MKIKDTPIFERLNNLSINVCQLSANDKTLSPKVVSKKFYDEQIHLLLFENQYCLITNLHNFCRNNEHYKNLCRSCLITYGDQTKLKERLLRCIEQKFFNLSYMHLNQKMKFSDWYVKIDPPMWAAADFECMNIPINDNDHVTDKLYINKPNAIGYNIVKNLDYENLNLEKDGYFKYFGEDCVEWFINEMLEIEGYMKIFF